MNTLLATHYARRGRRYAPPVLRSASPAPHHVLDVHILQPNQVKDHGVSQPELALQLASLTSKHGLQHLARDNFASEARYDHNPNVVQSPPPRPSCHLGVLARLEAPELDPVVLPDLREHDALGRHVNTHRERFGRAQDLHKTSTE